MSGFVAEESPYGAKRPQFLKILSPNSLLKLPIPRSFSKYLEKDKRQKVTIVSPVGKFWHVSLVQDRCDVFFDNGWEKFAQTHGLDEGNFVLFCYEGNMVFTVKIFHSNGCCADYSNIVQRYDLQEKMSLNDNFALRNAMKKPAVTCSVKKKKLEMPEMPRPRCSKRTKGLTQFERLVSPYNIDRGYMYVPLGLRPYFDLSRKTSEITVKDSGGREWPVHLWHGTKDSLLGRGWRQLAEDNNLKVGDRCIFQHVSDEVVHIQIIPEKEPKLEQNQ